MRFLSVVLLIVATALLANGGAGERNLGWDSPQLFLAVRSDAPTLTRLLRGGETTYAEERVIPGVTRLTEKTWATYIDLLNKKNPDKKVSMAAIISKSYGDDALARMIEVANKVPSQQKIAARLAAEQRENWAAAGKSVDDVFTLLRLDKAGDDLFENPQITAWYSYAHAMNEKRADTLVILTLKALYNDGGVAKILSAAKPNAIAAQLETAMQNGWLKKGLTSDQVFKLLNLDNNVDDLLTNPGLNSWMVILRQRTAKNIGMDAAMVQKFTKFYGDEAVSKMLLSARKVSSTEKLATRLQDAQYKQWLNGKTPDDVFKLLKLDDGVDSH
ncbi:hypothetical protein ON010_g9360 [Phytophthora cinnamomi]|nr:hypothetical protein ON010_g9360 [Phytophthora cinnamomi]